VAWSVRALAGVKPANWVDGVVEAEFQEGKIKALHLRAGKRADE
jgi:hypothetical protein